MNTLLSVHLHHVPEVYALAALLEEWNYRVVQAANGQEALSCLARPWQQVDVILSDVVMPRLGGVGLVKALRQDAQYAYLQPVTPDELHGGDAEVVRGALLLNAEIGEAH